MEDQLNSPLGIIYVVAILFVVGLLIFVGYIAYSNIHENLLEQEKFQEHERAEQAVKEVQGVGELMDYVYLFFILAFIIAMPIAAYFAPTHPAVFASFLFIFILALTLSVIFSDMFEMIGEEEAVHDEYMEMPILRTFMYYLPLIIIVNGVVTGIIFFGKARAGAGEY